MELFSVQRLEGEGQQQRLHPAGLRMHATNISSSFNKKQPIIGENSIWQFKIFEPFNVFLINHNYVDIDIPQSCDRLLKLLNGSRSGWLIQLLHELVVFGGLDVKGKVARPEHEHCICGHN